MSDRQNTIVCCFDPRSPRITAYHIHEWIHDNLHLAEDDVRMIQIDGPRRRVYIKFTSGERMQSVLQDCNGQLEFRHDNGELSQVTIELAGMGIKKIRIASLPPEVTENTIRDSLTKYGEVKNIREELWTSVYRYKVYNGIRIVDMNLKQHLPSHMSIAGNNALISYDGQPLTCYKCNETGHLQQDCPRRKRVGPPATVVSNSTWADIVAHSTKNTQSAMSKQATTPTHDTCSEESRTLVNEPSDRKINTQAQETQGTPDIECTATTTDEHKHDGQDNLSTDTSQMDTSEMPGGNEATNNTGTPTVETNHPQVLDKQRRATTEVEVNEPNKVSLDDRYDRAENKSPPTDDEQQQMTLSGSPKRNKKLRTERELSYRERTRSKTRHATPQRP